MTHAAHSLAQKPQHSFALAQQLATIYCNPDFGNNELVREKLNQLKSKITAQQAPLMTLQQISADTPQIEYQAEDLYQLFEDMLQDLNAVLTLLNAED